MSTKNAVLFAAVATLAGTAYADVIYETDDPFGGIFGILGFDVSQDQSVALRFTPEGEYRLDQLRLWLWNNDASGGHPVLCISLRDNAGSATESYPGETVYEKWALEMPTTGVFNPWLFDFPSLLRPRLHQGVHYWIVAESDAVGGWDPVWAIAGTGLGFMSFRDPPGPWWPGHSGMVASTIVLGSPVAPTPGDTDCDGVIDFGDINPFVLALGGSVAYYKEYPDCNWYNADCNGDGSVDFADINAFVALLTGQD